MLIGKVTGNVWATRKHALLEGKKYMTVQVLDDAGAPTGSTLVAADIIGAGVGETVLITTGSGARKALDNSDSPVDAAIVGIIDWGEVNKART